MAQLSSTKIYGNLFTNGEIETQKVKIESSGRIRMHGGTTYAMPIKSDGSYWGMCDSSGGTGNWIRTTSLGIIPYNSGGASALGTESWPFNNIFANNIYDNGILLENKFLALSGGTISGTISRPGLSTSWLEGAKGTASFINQTSYTGYCPLIRAKSTNGNWTVGLYANDNFHINYMLDSTINSDRNANDQQFTFFPNGNLTVPGEIRASKVYNAVYNDYAEYFEKDDIKEHFEPGDIIVSKNDKYTKSNRAYQKNVVGVFSDSYGHILGGVGNIEEDDKNCIPVGLSGRVLVKVVGKVEEGDMIVSSDIPGVGMAAKEFKMGTIIGKAVQSKNTEGIEKVKIIICLN